MQPVNMSRKCCLRRTLSLLVLIVLIFVQPGQSAEDARTGAALRSRVYKFKNITSAQAEELLSQLNIGKSYRALNEESLIVTSDSGPDLIKATEVYMFLEQITKPELRIIMSGDGIESVSLEAFTSTLKDMSPGSLKDAPPAGMVNPVIIDYVEGNLVAVGEQAVLDQLEKSLADYLDTLATDASEQPEFAPDDEGVTESDIELQAIEDAVDDTGQNQNSVQEEVVITDPNLPSLEEIAEQAFSEMIPDVNLPMEMADSQDEDMHEMLNEESQADESMTDEEDFFSDELLKALEDAEERAIAEAGIAEEDLGLPEQAVDTAVEEVVMPEENLVEAEATETEPAEDDPVAKLRALLASAGIDQEATEPQAEAVAEEQETATEQTELIEQVGPEKKVDPVQAEMEYLRQRLAELESQVSGKNPSGNAAGQSKIQSSTRVETEPKINPAISQQEVDTTLNVPQDIQLESLVELVGKMLGLNYMYDPAIFRGQTVKLKLHGGKIKVGEMYSLLETIFWMKGFAMTREGNLITIVKAPDAANVIRQVDTVIRTPGEAIEAGDIVVTTMFQLENIATATAKNMLINLNLGMKNGFQEVKETNTLMVTDYAYRMARIEKVLSIVDVPDSETQKKYEFRTLKYMKPSEIVPKLKELAGKLQGVSLQVSSGAETPAPTATRTVRTRNPTTGAIETRTVPVTTNTAANRNAAAAAAPSSDSVYIDTDDRTNRILIAGKAEDIALVNELIDALDVPQYDLKTVREYIIQYVEATEVVDVLNELGLASVSVSTVSTGRAAGARPAAAGGAAASAAGAEQPHVSIRPATNSLLVNATEEQHKAIELVIAHVDVVQKDQRTIRQYEIQFVGAQDILDTLTDLGIISSGSSQSGSSSRAASRTPSRTATRAGATNQPQPGEPVAVPVSLPTAEGGSEVSITAEQPQISILATTNSLLVYATPRQHDAIALVIAHADRQLDATSTPYVRYALENQDPTELAGVLNDIISKTVDGGAEGRTGAAKVGTSTGGAAGSANVNLPTLEEEKIRVIADEPSYSLIVYANKRNQQWISELIKELDEYRPQVLLDCTLVEITKQDEFNYDLNILSSIPDLTNTSGITGTIIPDDTTPVTKSTILTALNNATDRNQFIDLQSDSGTFTGFFGNKHVMALLDVMQSKNYGRVLANPKILVDDNKEGVIETKSTTYITRTSSTNIPGEGGQIVTTQNTEFEPYDASIKLFIKPHISKGDNLRLEIEMVRSDFVNFSSADDEPPDRAESNINTVVTVPDDSTIILGGMDRINQGKGGAKVPLLGDIPLLGTLFRSTSNSSTQSKLYIFIKPRILRPGEDMANEDVKRISQQYRTEFEAKEAEMQSYDDVPGLKPVPMDPKKVLKED